MRRLLKILLLGPGVLFVPRVSTALDEPCDLNFRPVPPISITDPPLSDWASTPPLNFTQTTSTPSPKSLFLSGQNLTNPLNSSPGTLPVQPRAIIGADEREYYMSAYPPYRSFGRLEVTLVDSRGVVRGISSCTGALVGPRHVATASHCLDAIKYPKSRVRFQPGYEECENPVISGGGAWAIHAYDTGFSTRAKDCSLFSDVAVIVLDTALGDLLGWIGFGIFSNSEGISQPIFNTFGYPADRGGGKRAVRQQGVSIMYLPSCGKGNPLLTNADSGLGMSGGPLWKTGENGQALLYGVLSSSLDTSTAGSLTSYSGGQILADMVLRAKLEYP